MTIQRELDREQAQQLLEKFNEHKHELAKVGALAVGVNLNLDDLILITTVLENHIRRLS